MLQGKLPKIVIPRQHELVSGTATQDRVFDAFTF